MSFSASNLSKNEDGFSLPSLPVTTRVFMSNRDSAFLIASARSSKSMLGDVATVLDDFEDASEIVTSGLYRHVYTAEYGQLGGKPDGITKAVCDMAIGGVRAA